MNCKENSQGYNDSHNIALVEIDAIRLRAALWFISVKNYKIFHIFSYQIGI